jgi:hypothetical protein
MRRTLATLAVLATTTLVPLAGTMSTASAAPADVPSCVTRLKEAGIGASTEQALEACREAEDGDINGCVTTALTFYVPPAVSRPICELATRD